MTQKGTLVIVDGIDGSGKGTIVKSLADWSQEKKLKVLDLKNYWQKKHTFPEPQELKKYDVIISAEPTYSMIGQAIREEIVRANGRNYSALATAKAFALDREVLYKRVIIPALKAGKTIFQERGVTTSLIYQPVQKEPLSLKKILSLEGNALALKYRPDLLIITKVSPKMAIKRLNLRKEKQDEAIFEKLDFLTKIDKRFQAPWFKKIFEDMGSKIIYLNTETTLAETKNQAVGIWEEFGLYF